MKHGSLFSGIGGFDLAAEWMGWENVFHCEWNKFGKQVLKYYWPNAISYDDITKTDFTIHRGSIDILTGGFPCQPYSSAGKRKGTADDRHLWPEMLRAIREIQPRYVVGENVRGLTNWNGGLVFDRVQADLEAEGFEVLPFLLPACAVNAPHRRDRIWFVAHANSNGQLQQRIFQKQQRGAETFSTSQIRNVANSNSEGYKRRESGKNRFKTAAGKGQENKRERIRKNTSGIGATGIITDTGSKRLSVGVQRGIGGVSEKETSFEGRESSRTHTKIDWQEFPSQSPVCSRDDGFPYKLAGLSFSKFIESQTTGYGNAIVPQLAYQIFKAIDQTELKLK